MVFVLKLGKNFLCLDADSWMLLIGCRTWGSY